MRLGRATAAGGWCNEHVMGGFTCVLAFDTLDPEFARGVELGRLLERLRADPEPLSGLVHISNAEMVLRVADALGRPVVGEEYDGTWMIVRFAGAEGRVY